MLDNKIDELSAFGVKIYIHFFRAKVQKSQKNTYAIIFKIFLNARVRCKIWVYMISEIML